MGFNSLKSVDDLDTRREVWECFCKLPPLERTAFLLWCCDTLNRKLMGAGSGVFYEISNETGECMESYLDFFTLIGQYGLDSAKALAELESRASKFSRAVEIYTR
jgi:ribosomal protein L37AE/L43A